VIRITDCSGYQGTWDGVSEASPAGTIFHKDAWIGVLERSLGIRVKRLAAEEGGEVVGIIPVSLNITPDQWGKTRRLPLSASSPPVNIETPYGGPIALPGREEAVFHLVRHLLRRTPSTRVIFSPDPAEAELTYPGLGGLAKVQTKRTYIVDLDLNRGALWSNCKGNMRTHVRKARKLGVRFTTSDRFEDLDDFLRLIRMTYSRAGFSPLPGRFYREVFATYAAEGMAMLFFAEVDGYRAAAEISLIDGDRLYSWSGGSDQDFWKFRANNLLSWGVLDWGRSRGLSMADLCGAGPPSIARYKKSLGGRACSYPFIDVQGRIYGRVGNLLQAIRARGNNA